MDVVRVLPFSLKPRFVTSYLISGSRVPRLTENSPVCLPPSLPPHYIRQCLYTKSCTVSSPSHDFTLSKGRFLLCVSFDTERPDRRVKTHFFRPTRSVPFLVLGLIVKQFP